jgi:hypothetical protein
VAPSALGLDPAGTPDGRDQDGIWHEVGQDYLALVRRPLNPGPHGWRFASLVFGTTALLYVVREDIRDWVQDSRSETRSDILQLGRNQGKGAFAPAMALGLFLWARVADRSEGKLYARRLLEGCVAAAAVAGVGSFILAAERPEDGNSVTLFDPEGHGVSLDVSLAACPVYPLSRSVLAPRPHDTGGKRFARGLGRSLLWAGAILTAFQRMDADKHWAPDVFLGLMNGLTMGRWMTEIPGWTDPVEASRQAAAPRRLSWYVTGSGAGLRIRLGPAPSAARAAWTEPPTASRFHRP